MKLLIVASTLAIIAFAKADVSHLPNAYIPPSNEYLPPQQTYGAPSIGFSSGGGGGGGGAGLGSYAIGGGISGGGISGGGISGGYIPPAAPSYSHGGGGSLSGAGISYSSGGSYSSGDIGGISGGSYLAPAAPSFSHGGSIGGGQLSGISYTGPQTFGTAPASEYLPPSSGPSYSAPIQSYAGSSVGYSSGGIDTQYAANGGYVYKKK